MDPYILAAGILVGLGSIAGFIAFFIGRDRMLTELYRAWDEADQ